MLWRTTPNPVLSQLNKASAHQHEARNGLIKLHECLRCYFAAVACLVASSCLETLQMWGLMHCSIYTGQ